MGCRLWCDEDHQPYYELVCDGCGASFTCFDDSCYDWRLLHDAALYTGWDTAGGRPDGPHHCPSCQRTHRKGATHMSQHPDLGPADLPGGQVPDADRAEQHRLVDDDEADTVPAAPEAVEVPGTDAIEQRQPVPLNDDDYPTTPTT